MNYARTAILLAVGVESSWRPASAEEGFEIMRRGSELGPSTSFEAEVPNGVPENTVRTVSFDTPIRICLLPVRVATLETPKPFCRDEPCIRINGTQIDALRQYLIRARLAPGAV